MTCNELLDDFCARSQSATGRIRSSVEGLDESALNRQPQPGVWSPAQILDHLHIANGTYIPLMQDAIASGPKGDEDVRHSMLGRFIVKALKSKSAPAPKQLTPGDGPFGKEIVNKWLEQQAAMEELARAAKGTKLTSFKVRNPFIPLFKMNAADCFEIIASHMEYHAPQIEERSK